MSVISWNMFLFQCQCSCDFFNIQRETWIQQRLPGWNASSVDSRNWFARSIRKCLLSDGRDYLRLLINVAAFIRHTATLTFFPETFRGLELLKWTDSNKSLLLFIKMNIFRDGLLVWKGFNQWLTAKCDGLNVEVVTWGQQNKEFYTKYTCRWRGCR